MNIMPVIPTVNNNKSNRAQHKQAFGILVLPETQFFLKDLAKQNQVLLKNMEENFDSWQSITSPQGRNPMATIIKKDNSLLVKVYHDATKKNMEARVDLGEAGRPVPRLLKTIKELSDKLIPTLDN